MKLTHMAALLASGAAALSLGLPASAEPDGATGTRFSIKLTGEAEGPGLGDRDGAGMAELAIDPAASKFCYSITVEGIAPARYAHIHKSPVGEAGGPIVVQMQPPVEGKSEGCINLPTEVGQALLNRPADFYVNIHNAEHPGGAIRGQLG